MTKDETILKIAQDNGIVSPNGLTTANTDREDFYEVAVWSVKKALEQAYEAGRQALAADLQRDLMNLPATGIEGCNRLCGRDVSIPYKYGHRDARHAAVEKVLELTKDA